MSCNYRTTVHLPKLHKKILYLDQFFFSSAFRKHDSRFTKAAERIRQVSALQLLAVPFSSIHEDETHQWRGFDGKSKDDLMKFIKDTSRGHEFEPAYNVEETQVILAFEAFLRGDLETFKCEEHDSICDNIHEWEDYLRIDVGGYIGDIELIRDLKHKSVEELVDKFSMWRTSPITFEQSIAIDLSNSARMFIDSYITYAMRIASGDYMAEFDSPIMSRVVQSMMSSLPEAMGYLERLRKIGGFFRSKHFAEVPCQWISVRIYAVLKDMVTRGAYTNRKTALKRLGGFFKDVEHISIYAPYCDAFIMDQPMAALVADPRISLEARYGVKIFSLNNWSDLFTWLDELESGITQEHRAGLKDAYR
ncbi:hypothetical protein [Azotobacter beijerinckii]|nr:hypothetical protein [Azotobacter beijerinckii]